jgi:hypothetical protein
MNVESMAALIPIVAIVGGITVAVVSVISRARVREMEIKERIAMIERGLVPAPEVDPRGFDRAMNRLERHEIRGRYRGNDVAGGRHRRAGVSLMGVGFGLMVLIAFAGENPSTAVGVGGFLVVMGLAFFINSLIDTRTEGSSAPQDVVPPPPPPPPVDQPR